MINTKKVTLKMDILILCQKICYQNISDQIAYMNNYVCTQQKVTLSHKKNSLVRRLFYIANIVLYIYP